MIQLLQKVCNILENEQIPYMFSGSMALNVYTLPRMTRDIDLVVKMKEEDVEKFVKAFQNDFYCYEPTIKQEVLRQGMFNLIDNQTSLKVDFIVCKDTLYRQTEFERRQKTTVLGFDAWVVSIEDLIISKLIWIQQLQSEKQMLDIQSLLEIKQIDVEYLEKWVKKLNLVTFNLI